MNYSKITKILIVVLLAVIAFFGGLIYSKQLNNHEKVTVVGKKTNKETTAKINRADIVSINASSVQTDSLSTHYAKLVNDQNPATAWAEDADGSGIGESLTFTFNDSYLVSGMKIEGGYFKSSLSYQRNNRLKDFTLTYADGSEDVYTLEDQMKEQTIRFDSAVKTKSVKLTIDSVYEGSEYDDTCISEISFF